MKRGCMATAALLLCAVAGSAGAVTTDTWKVSGSAAFLATDLESLSVSSEGVVTPAPAFEEVEDFDADYVWSLAASGDRVWAGTGSGGALFRVDGRAARLVHDSIALQVESIAIGRDGTVYAGTAPDATILAIAADGTARTFADLPERHVWAMAFDASGNLLAATGDRARLYRIGAGGAAEVLYEGEGDHFTSLAVRGSTILLGAGEKGLLYSLDDKGRATVLMDADEEEVKGIILLADGSVIAAVNPPVGSAGGGKSGDAASAKKPSPVLYRIRPNNVVEPVWTATESVIQAIAADPEGRVYAATGGGESGGIYRVDPATGDWALLSRPGPPQILSLAVSGGVLHAGSGSPGKVYRGALGGSPVGRMTSEVRDMKQVADWGVLRWQRADRDGGGSIAFRTRTGNTADPDGTWSDWSSPLTGAAGSQVTSPAARFIQWRAEFKRGGEGAPALREVTLSSLARNRAPVVRSFDVSAPGLPLGRGGDSGPQPVIQSLPGNVRAEFSVASQSGRGPAPDEDAAWARRYRTLRWDASDPNDDPMMYTLEYRGGADAAWRPLEDDLKEPLYVFDSSQVEDGVYRFRVTASDAPRNPPGEALEGSRETDFVVVDNTVPVIDALTARVDGAKIRVTAKLRDALSPIKQLEISTDGENWRPVHPVDRVMDELEEDISVDLDLPAKTPVTVILRVADLAGNVGTARVSP